MNYHKGIHHPRSTLPVGKENTKSVFLKYPQTLFLTECPGVFSSRPNWRGDEVLLLESERRETASWEYLQKHMVVIRD